MYYFNFGCYHLFFSLCCCIIAVIHKSCLISPRFIHFLPSYAHFIYSPRSLAFSYSFCVILAAREQLVVAQRASSLAYSFISPDFPCRSHSLQPIVHCTTSHLTRPHACTSFTHTHYTYIVSYPPLPSNVILYRLALV